MKKLEAEAFLKDVLEEIDSLPEGFERRLLSLLNSATTQRRERIRKLFSDRKLHSEVNSA